MREYCARTDLCLVIKVPPLDRIRSPVSVFRQEDEGRLATSIHHARDESDPERCERDDRGECIEDIRCEPEAGAKPSEVWVDRVPEELRVVRSLQVIGGGR